MVKISVWGSPNIQYLDMGVAGKKGWETLLSSYYLTENLIKIKHTVSDNIAILDWMLLLSLSNSDSFLLDHITYVFWFLIKVL